MISNFVNDLYRSITVCVVEFRQYTDGTVIRFLASFHSRRAFTLNLQANLQFHQIFSLSLGHCAKCKEKTNVAHTQNRNVTLFFFLNVVSF